MSNYPSIAQTPGEGNEIIKAKFNSNDMSISFNSKYLLDIAQEVRDKNIIINLKDSVSLC